MPSFVVMSTSSKCGPMTIQADSALVAAKLYSQSCCETDDPSSRIWVWTHTDYHSEPNMRPEPMEYPMSELLEGA